MSARYELYTRDPETGKRELSAFTNSDRTADRWQARGGLVIDTKIHDLTEAQR